MYLLGTVRTLQSKHIDMAYSVFSSTNIFVLIINTSNLLHKNEDLLYFIVSLI